MTRWTTALALAAALAPTALQAAPAVASGAYDNTLLLAEELGVGSADLSRIEVRGAPIAQVRYQFR